METTELKRSRPRKSGTEGNKIHLISNHFKVSGKEMPDDQVSVPPELFNIFSSAMRKAVPDFDIVAGKSLIPNNNDGLVVKGRCHLSLFPTQRGLSLNIDISLLSRVVIPPGSSHEWKLLLSDMVKKLTSSKLLFGYKVRDDFTSISDARVLNPPKLRCREMDVHPRNGRWEMKDKRMFNAVAVRNWIGVNLSVDLDEKEAYSLMLKLVKLCINKGMIFSHQPLQLSQLTPTDDIERKLIEIQEDVLAQFQVEEEEERIQLAIIILPNTVDGSYGLVKRICETKLGVVSQCIDRTRGFSSQYFEELAFKINAKVGGQNTPVVDCLRRVPTPGRTMLFGVCLDQAPLGEDGPTILAVVASVDWPGAYDYRCLFSSQPEGKELQNMISNHLMRFRRNVHFLPDRIVFYRVKVEEQISKDFQGEVKAIYQACESLEGNYRPCVTFITVQQNHHTCLSPHVDSRTGNILAGTVVDTKICHPTELDFYLCSHAIHDQDTCTPTHYNLVWDTNNFTMDSIQALTYHLCYMYAGSTHAVPVVAPAYYAGLAAIRARHYIKADAAAQLPEINEFVQDSMFFI